MRKREGQHAAVPCKVEISCEVCDARGQNIDARVREFNVDREGHVVALQVRYFCGKHIGLNVERLG